MGLKSFPYDIEQLKVDRKGIISLRINMISGLDEFGHYVCIAPSLNLSGYGKNKKEAIDSFEQNLDLFICDVNALSNKKRLEYIASLGWEKHERFNKQFSRSYIDAEGELQGLQIKKPTIQSLETEISD